MTETLFSKLNVTLPLPSLSGDPRALRKKYPVSNTSPMAKTILNPISPSALSKSIVNSSIFPTEEFVDQLSALKHGDQSEMNAGTVRLSDPLPLDKVRNFLSGAGMIDVIIFFVINIIIVSFLD